MTNQLEEFIEEKSIRCKFGLKPFVPEKEYVTADDLREFFKDKEIIDTNTHMILLNEKKQKATTS